MPFHCGTHLPFSEALGNEISFSFLVNETRFLALGSIKYRGIEEYRPHYDQHGGAAAALLCKAKMSPRMTHQHQIYTEYIQFFCLMYSYVNPLLHSVHRFPFHLL